jgi:sarcosine oxidase, subunit gamma
MAELHYQSALNAREASGLSIRLREIPERGMIDLRGVASDRKFMNSAKDVLGLDLPKTPRTSTSWGDTKVLWLSIDQWLILCPRSKVLELLASLRKRLQGFHSLAVDVSDMRAILRLEGEGIREVLLKGTSLDLLSDDYAPGTVRRLRFAEVAALLHIVEEDIIDLYVFRSYAEYAWDFLCTAARAGSEVELFGKQVVPGV